MSSYPPPPPDDEEPPQAPTYTPSQTPAGFQPGSAEPPAEMQPSGPPVLNNQPRPGAGRPLVEGPPDSVGPPISGGFFNTLAGIGWIGIGVVALVVLVILLVVLIRVL